MSDESQRSFSIARVLLLAVPLAIVAYLGTRQYRGQVQAGAKQQQIETTVRRLLGSHATSPKLSEDYQDADGDMVADSPSDLALCLDPEEVVFSYVASTFGGDDQATWQPLVDALADELNRPREMGEVCRHRRTTACAG